MNVTTHTDVDALTLTTTAQLPTNPERAWQLVSDPRQLERWWGPPEWPATFVRYEFEAGGRAQYFMQGPDGEKMHGWWNFVAITAPVSLSIEDGFGDENGEPSGELGAITANFSFEPSGDGVRLTIVSGFESTEHLEAMAEMGMEEGMRTAVAQISAILAED